MSTEVERARGLEREGIQTDRVRWNLSTAALYEEAVRRQEGVIAADGPLACRTGQHTGRSPNDKFVVREPSSEAEIAWGKVNRPMEPAQFDALHQDLLASLAGQGAVRARLLRRRRSGLPAAGPRHQRVRLAQPVLPQPVHRRPGGGRGAPRRSSRSSTRRASRPIPRATARNSDVVIALNFAKKLVLIGGTQLRRRDEEVDLLGPELHPAAAERAVDALLGEHRRRAATPRCSSACRAPARRRCRAIPIAC